VEIDEPASDSHGDLEPPKCPQCGSPVRPDVVWFGEMLPPGVFQKAEAASSVCDVMLVVGTSGMVQPAANLPLVASAAGATVVEVNVEPSQLTHYVDIFLEGPAGEVLPELVARLAARRS
jgi:NAD-dependent deacetylase